MTGDGVTPYRTPDKMTINLINMIRKELVRCKVEQKLKTRGWLYNYVHY